METRRTRRSGSLRRSPRAVESASNDDVGESVGPTASTRRTTRGQKSVTARNTTARAKKTRSSSRSRKQEEKKESGNAEEYENLDEVVVEREQRKEEPNEDDSSNQEDELGKKQAIQESGTTPSRRRSRRKKDEELKDSEKVAADENHNYDVPGSDQPEGVSQRESKTEQETHKMNESETSTAQRKSSRGGKQEQTRDSNSAAAYGDQVEDASRSKLTDGDGSDRNEGENLTGDSASLDTSLSTSRRLFGDEKDEREKVDTSLDNGPGRSLEARSSARLGPEVKYQGGTGGAEITAVVKGSPSSKDEIDEPKTRNEGGDESKEQITASSAAAKNSLSSEKEVEGSRKKDRDKSEQLKGALVKADLGGSSSGEKGVKTDLSSSAEDSKAAGIRKHDRLSIDDGGIVLPGKESNHQKGKVDEAAEDSNEKRLRPPSSADDLSIHVEHGHPRGLKSKLDSSVQGGSNKSFLNASEQIGQVEALMDKQSEPMEQALSNQLRDSEQRLDLDSKTPATPRASEGGKPTDLSAAQETAVAALVELFASPSHAGGTSGNGYQKINPVEMEVDGGMKAAGYETDLENKGDNSATTKEMKKSQDGLDSIQQEAFLSNVGSHAGQAGSSKALSGDEVCPEGRTPMNNENSERSEVDSGIALDRHVEMSSAVDIKLAQKLTGQLDTAETTPSIHTKSDDLPSTTQTKMKFAGSANLRDSSTVSETTIVHHSDSKPGHEEEPAETGESVSPKTEITSVSNSNLNDVLSGAQDTVTRHSAGEGDQESEVAKTAVPMSLSGTSRPTALSKTEPESSAKGKLDDRSIERENLFTQSSGEKAERAKAVESTLSTCRAAAPVFSTTTKTGSADVKLADGSSGLGKAVAQLSGRNEEQDAELAIDVKSTPSAHSSAAPLVLQMGTNSVANSILDKKSTDLENMASQSSVRDAELRTEAAKPFESAPTTDNSETAGISQSEMILANSMSEYRSSGPHNNVAPDVGVDEEQVAASVKDIETKLTMRDPQLPIVSQIEESGSVANIRQVDGTIVLERTKGVKSGDGEEQIGGDATNVAEAETRDGGSNELLHVEVALKAISQPEMPGKSSQDSQGNEAAMEKAKELPSKHQLDGGQQSKVQRAPEAWPSGVVNKDTVSRTTGAVTGPDIGISGSSAVLDRRPGMEYSKRSARDFSKASSDNEQSDVVPLDPDEAYCGILKKGALEDNAETTLQGTGKKVVEFGSSAANEQYPKKESSDEQDSFFDAGRRPTKGRQIRPKLDQDVVCRQLPGSSSSAHGAGHKRSREGAIVPSTKRKRVETESMGSGLPATKPSIIRKRRSSLQRMKVALFSEGSAVHGRGYERMFAAYWEALSMRLEGNPTKSNSEKSQAVFDSFLKTKRLRKLHNRLVLGLLKQCIRTRVPVEEASNCVPLSWRSRIRLVSEDDTQKRHDAAEARKAHPEPSSTQNYAPMFPDSTQYAPLKEDRPCVSELRIPGALAIDPHLRARGQSTGMKVAENTIWLLVVAMKEYTNTVLKSSIAHRNAIEEGRLPPPTLPRARMLAKKKNATENNDSANMIGVATATTRCITAADIHAMTTSSSVGAIRSLGGTTSRLTFERTLFASATTGKVSGAEAFGDVQRFISSQISPPVPVQTGDSNVRKDESSVQEPAGVRHRDRKSPSTGMGLGRGAKDLAALKARTSITAKSSSGVAAIPTAGAGTTNSLVGTSVNPQSSSTAAGTVAPPDKSSDAPREDAGAAVAPIDPAGSQKAVPETEHQSVAMSRRGKGFGVKNLAAMRARSLTLQRTGENDEPAASTTGEGQQAADNANRDTETAPTSNRASQP